MGDPVRLFKNVCESSGRRTACHREEAGSGKVTELLDDHDSVVSVPAGTPVEEGYTVEKAR